MQDDYVREGREEVSDRVNRLVCTSVEDCKSSLPFESSRKVLNQALKAARRLKKKTMARNIEARIRQLSREGGKGAGKK